MLRPIIGLLGFIILGCSGGTWKSITAAVVGKTVETTKGVTSGVAEGFEEGRKSGDSIDGATLVSNSAELQAIGSVSIHQILSADGGAMVVVALENDGDVPMRVVGMELLALDGDGFVQRPVKSPSKAGVTVPARAKERIEVPFGIPPEQMQTIRLWNEDLALPTAGAAAPAEGAASDAGAASDEAAASE